MVKVTKGDMEFYVDGYLKNNLDICLDIVHKDWDMVFVIDGTEGSGKSVLAQQIAKYFDPSFCLDRIVFRAKNFKDEVIKAEKNQAVVWDEALSGLSSRGAMSTVNKTIVDLLAEIRQKNLFLIIVLPTFFDLDKYVALWRSRFLIHVHHDKFKRGFFNFYNESCKKFLYINGKKFYNYKCAVPSFRGRFTNFYTVDQEEYKAKKLSSLRATDEDEKPLAPRHKRWLEQRDAAFFVFKEKFGWKAKEIKNEIEKYGVEMPEAHDINKIFRKLRPELGE
jgi:hypothetical protein